MTFVAVLPGIFDPWTERCIRTMSKELLLSLVVVDNTIENIGVSASWNLGIDRMFDTDADWLVILSAAMRFGTRGGSDFIEEMEKHPDAIAVEAGHGLGWHCIGFPRSTIERVGRFDPVFPAYFEDIDYGRRVHLAWPEIEPPYWVKTSNLDLAFAGFSHGVDLAGVEVDNDVLRRAYIKKWGGDKGEEEFDRPYDDPTLDWTFTGAHA